MALITESDVYHALSYHIWKSPRDIWEELRDEKGVRGIKRYMVNPSIYFHLDNLVQQGYAEFRERQLTPEHLAIRRGIPENEYHLTPQGIQHRQLFDEREIRGLEGELEPATFSSVK